MKLLLFPVRSLTFARSKNVLVSCTKRETSIQEPELCPFRESTLVSFNNVVFLKEVFFIWLAITKCNHEAGRSENGFITLVHIWIDYTCGLPMPNVP